MVWKTTNETSKEGGTRNHKYIIFRVAYAEGRVVKTKFAGMILKKIMIGS